VGRPTRRALLAGALALTTLGGARPSRHSAPTRLASATIVQGSFISAAMNGAKVGWAVSYPAGTTLSSTLPVVLALHGGFGNHLQVFDGMGMMRAQSDPRLVTDVAVASVDAGTSYYHRRADGTDTGAMIVQDLLPALAARGLDTSRLGLTGYSMGGYGALLLGATVLHDQVAAVAPISAALWQTVESAEPFAFDAAQDYADHNVFAMRAVLSERPLQVACGLQDPFLPDNLAFVGGFDTPPSTQYAPGGHDNAYWSAAAASQLSFLSQYLVDRTDTAPDL
jgi:enterochelin esterase-like enzyme